MQERTIAIQNVHPALRVIKPGQTAKDAIHLADVASKYFDQHAATKTPITRKHAWKLALHDFSRGMYQLAPERKRKSTNPKP